MRRLSAAALLTMFSLALIVPVLSQPAEAKLPACCRRDGKHGCAMTKQGESGREAFSSLRAKCPVYPSGQATAGSAQFAGGGNAPGIWTPALAPAAAVEHAETQYRVSFSRAWHKRGPPSLLS